MQRKPNSITFSLFILQEKSAVPIKTDKTDKNLKDKANLYVFIEMILKAIFQRDRWKITRAPYGHHKYDIYFFMSIF